MTHVLAISADRSKRGIMIPGSAAYTRQKAYAEKFGALDIINFSLSKDPFEKKEDDSLRIIPTKSLNRLFYIWNAVRIASKLPWPDVVTVQDPFETGFAGLIIARSIGKPLHVQIHTDFLSSAYAKLSLMNRIRAALAGYVLKRAVHIRVVSQGIKNSIQAKYQLQAPITVLPIFVDLSKVRAAKPPQDRLDKFAAFKTKVLFVGRFEPEKHPCLALESFASAAPEDACLIMVGAGSELEHLKELAQSLGVTTRVFFEGEKESAPYYPLADLVLVTSRYEGYGLVIVEALAAGKPVLATDVGVARDAGAIVSSESEYARDLKKWFADGPRKGELLSYPYTSFEEYVDAYCSDVAACIIER